MDNCESSSFQVQAELFLNNLKNIINKQHVENVNLKRSLEDEISKNINLEAKNTQLTERIKVLESSLKLEKSRKSTKRKKSLSRKPSTSSIKENGDELIQLNSEETKSSESSTSTSRSSSFKRNKTIQDPSETSSKLSTEYELSSDMKDIQIEAIRNYYGAEKSDKAARIIQHAFRQYQMKKKFSKIRRKHSIKQHNRRLTVDCVRRIDSNSSYIKKSSQSDTDVSYNETEGCVKHNFNINMKADESVGKLSVDNLQTGDEYTNEKKAPESPKVLVTSPTSSSSIESIPSTYEVVKNPTSNSELHTEDTISPSANNTDFLPSGEACSEENAQSNKKLPEFKQESTGLEKIVEDKQEAIEDAQLAELPLETESKVLNEKPPTAPPTEEEIVKRILANDPVMPYMDPNSSLYKKRKQRKRHGYETVKEIKKQASNDESKKSENTSVQDQNSNEAVELADSTMSVNSSSTSLQSNTEITATTADNSSLKSYDTSSMTSELSTSTTTSQEQLMYQRRSTVSRESWHHADNDILRKRFYRIGLNLFNRKPTKGLEFLVEKKFCGMSAAEVGKFLINRKGLSRQMVGEFLGNNSEFSKQVLQHACHSMDFTHMDIDQALRKFQSQVRVQGEAQKVERLIEAFSARYMECNKEGLMRDVRNKDSIFLLAFAIIMLNTDLHSPNMKNEKRMTEEGFIRNLRGIDDGQDLSEDMLRNVYERIKKDELITDDDHVTQVLSVENNIVGKKPNLAVPHRRLVCFCRLYQVIDPLKPQKSTLHQREVFLFNDMMLVTKILQKKKMGTTYTFKHSLSLHGLSFLLFENTNFSNGVKLIGSMDSKPLMMFNAPSSRDRSKFVADLKEAIAEVEQMESMRIGAELEKAQCNSISPSTSRRNSLQLQDAKKISASMCDLNDNGMKSPTGQFSNRPISMYASMSTNNNSNSHLKKAKVTSQSRKMRETRSSTPALNSVFGRGSPKMTSFASNKRTSKSKYFPTSQV